MGGKTCQCLVAVVIRVELVSLSIPHASEAIARECTRKLLEGLIEVAKAATWCPEGLIPREAAARSTHACIFRKAHVASMTLGILLLHQLQVHFRECCVRVKKVLVIEGLL